MTKRRISKWAGYVSTFAVFILGVTPGTFGIPLMLHPWILIASIAWVVVYCSGVFSS